jgi:hypothetical protein
VIIRTLAGNTNAATTGTYSESSGYRYFTFPATGTITF